MLAPADGVITSWRVGYQQSLNQTISYKSDKANFDEKIKEVKLNIDKSLDPQYLNGKMTINIGNGIIIYIHGLKGDITFKEGQRIKKGDPIGKVAYSYYKIKRPSICIGIGHNGKSSDPMAPFGLKKQLHSTENYATGHGNNKQAGQRGFSTSYRGAERIISWSLQRHYTRKNSAGTSMQRSPG